MEQRVRQPWGNSGVSITTALHVSQCLRQKMLPGCQPTRAVAVLDSRAKREIKMMALAVAEALAIRA